MGSFCMCYSASCFVFSFPRSVTHGRDSSVRVKPLFLAAARCLAITTVVLSTGLHKCLCILQVFLAV